MIIVFSAIIIEDVIYTLSHSPVKLTNIPQIYLCQHTTLPNVQNSHDDKVDFQCLINYMQASTTGANNYIYYWDLELTQNLLTLSSQERKFRWLLFLGQKSLQQDSPRFHK